MQKISNYVKVETIRLIVYIAEVTYTVNSKLAEMH